LMAAMAAASPRASPRAVSMGEVLSFENGRQRG
jgi:hypothetical protein